MKKPDMDFIHVKVKTLKELIGYIEFFEPIFSDTEMDVISKEIINLYERELNIK